MKIEMGKFDDALLHLRETESMFRSVVSDNKITDFMREVASERNDRLAMTASQEAEEKLKAQQLPKEKPVLKPLTKK